MTDDVKQLGINMEIKKHLDFDTILKENNLVQYMDVDDCENIGYHILHNYEDDDNSRGNWKEKYAETLKLVMQYMEEKTFPWSGSSNVKFPLLTTSALQYHARAYPALINGDKPVQCRVIGADPDGSKQERAKRVSDHMSFQILEEDTGYEEDLDKSLIIQSLMGCAFRKTYYNGHHNVTELVLPDKMVVNYWARSLDSSDRFTHVMNMSHNEITERVRRKLFVDIDCEEFGMVSSNIIDITKDEIDGRHSPHDDSTPYEILEQHLWLDLDGDNYREPYIGFVLKSTGQLLRLVSRFERDKVEYDEDNIIIKITPERYFTKMPFIPSPDGSFYDIGFGVLLGATNDVINTMINMLIDSGAMATLGGGFLGKGVKVRGGEYSFKPQEWKRTDSTGEDLNKNIYPLPVREPSNVLFQLLGLMIDWGSRIGMSTDALSGQNPGQNQKVGTTEAVIDQGEKVFNGIYKRTYRSLKEEFRLMYRLNYLNPPKDGVFRYSNGKNSGGDATYQDYFESDKSIVPSADPSVSSPEKRLQRLMVVRNMAASSPGYNKYVIDKMILDLLEIPMVDQILPPPGSQNAPQAAPPYQIQVQQIKSQTEMAKLQAKLNEHRDKLMETKRLNEAKILELQAMAALNSTRAGVEENDKIMKMMDGELKIAQHQIDNVNQILEHAQNIAGDKNDGSRNMGSMDQNSGNQGVQEVPQMQNTPTND
jgi:chaperonin GroES